MERAKPHDWPLLRGLAFRYKIDSERTTRMGDSPMESKLAKEFATTIVGTIAAPHQNCR